MWTVKNLKKQKIDACQWRDGGREENGGRLSKGYRLPVIRWISSGGLMCIVTLQKANRDCSVSSSNWSWNPFQRTSNNTDRTQFINLQIKTAGSSVNFSLVEDMLYAASLLDFNSEVNFSCFLEILPDLLYILEHFDLLYILPLS